MVYLPQCCTSTIPTWCTSKAHVGTSHNKGTGRYLTWCPCNTQYTLTASTAWFLWLSLALALLHRHIIAFSCTKPWAEDEGRDEDRSEDEEQRPGERNEQGLKRYFGNFLEANADFFSSCGDHLRRRHWVVLREVGEALWVVGHDDDRDEKWFIFRKSFRRNSHRALHQHRREHHGAFSVLRLVPQWTFTSLKIKLMTSFPGKALHVLW